MKPKESIEIRRAMADMHESVLHRIDSAYKNELYIEVCWLCYACFESRVNRTLAKVCSGCTKAERTDKRRVGITTKLECYIRLIKSNYSLFQEEDINLLYAVKGWCKERNNLIHGMVSLEYYNDADVKFKNLSKSGIALVKRMYSFSTNIRNKFYESAEIPIFNDDVVQKCSLKSKCMKLENENVGF